MMEQVAISVLLLLCVVCYGMAMCCGKLSQWDAAEEAFSKSLRIYTAMFPFGHEMIFDSEAISVEMLCMIILLLSSSRKTTQALAAEIWTLVAGDF